MGNFILQPSNRGRLKSSHTVLTTWRLPHSCQEFAELLKGTSAVHEAPPPRLWVSIVPLVDAPFAFMCLLLRDACLILAQLHLT